MTQSISEDAYSHIRNFMRTQFAGVAFGLQAVGIETPAPMPEEAELLSPNAVPKRRLEFAAGRHAARVALKTLGHGPRGISKGKSGQPLWPDNVVGAITHTDTLAIAVATGAETAKGLGVDLEVLNRFRPDIASAVLTEDEANWVHDQLTLGAVFSAKEATYKAIFPTINKVIGFQDVQLKFNEDKTRFDAIAETPFFEGFEAGQTFLSGQVLHTEGMILSVAIFR